MFGRPDTRDERGVAGIGDRREDAHDTVCIGAFSQKAAKSGDLELMLVCVRDVVRAQAVDGDHKDRMPLLGDEGCGEKEKAENDRSYGHRQDSIVLISRPGQRGAGRQKLLDSNSGVALGCFR